MPYGNLSNTSLGLRRPTKHDMTNDNLVEQIRTLIDIEQRSASVSPITPLDVSRMLNAPLEDVEKCMKKMGL